MTGILSPAPPADALGEVLRRCRSPVISLRSVISIQAVSTNCSAHLLAGELIFSCWDFIAGYCRAK
jgi:hypothetical protein